MNKRLLRKVNMYKIVILAHYIDRFRDRLTTSWTATILGHDEEIYSTEAATEIPIC